MLLAAECSPRLPPPVGEASAAYLTAAAAGTLYRSDQSREF